MDNHLLPLFELPELPEHDGSAKSFRSSNINHFITKVLPCTFETIKFLESSGPEFDQWVEENRGETDRSLFIEQLSIWRRELLPWMSMVNAAEECASLTSEESCIHHGGSKEQCVLALPFMWSSNEEAITSLVKTCISHYRKRKIAEGKSQDVRGDYKISAHRADRVADALVDSGWRFVISGAYTRKSDGSLLKNDNGRHFLMWDYDRQRFVDALNIKNTPQVMLDALNEIVAGGLTDALFANLERALERRLIKRYGESIFVVDSMPSYLVPTSNGDYNVILQRLYPMSPFHAPKERIETPFEDWSDQGPPRLGTHGKTWDDLLDDWSTTPFGTVHRGRRLHLEQIAYQVLLGYNAFDSIFILSGDGSDGKSTFMNTLSGIIGSSRVSSASLNTLSTQSKDAEEVVLSLGFKYAVLSSDADDSFTISNTSYLKSLSSGEMITVVPKYRSAINTSFSGMIVQAMNGLPRFSEAAPLAMSRRLNYVLFENPQVFSQQKSAYDPSLAEDLARPSTRSYLLWRYLSGQHSAGLAYSGLASVDNRLAMNRMGSTDSASTFVQWLEEHGILDGETIPYLPKNTLRAVYGVYMDQEYDNQFPKSHKTFFSIVKNELSARGYVPDVDSKGREKRYRISTFFDRLGAPFLAALRKAGLSEVWIAELSSPRSENFSYGETRAFVFKKHKVQKSYQPAQPVRRASFGRFFRSLGSEHARYCAERGVDVNDASSQQVLYDPIELVDYSVPQEFVPQGMPNKVAGFLHDIPYHVLHLLSRDIVKVNSVAEQYMSVLYDHGCGYRSPNPQCLFPHDCEASAEFLCNDSELKIDAQDLNVFKSSYSSEQFNDVINSLMVAYKRFTALDGFFHQDELSTLVHLFCAEKHQVFGFGPASDQRFPQSVAYQLFLEWLSDNDYAVDDVSEEIVYSYLDKIFAQQGFGVSGRQRLSAWKRSEAQWISTLPPNVQSVIESSDVRDTRFYVRPLVGQDA